MASDGGGSDLASPSQMPTKKQQLATPSFDNYQAFIQQEWVRKTRDRAARNCRIQINRVSQQGNKMDYLTPQRETRIQRNAASKPYDWTDIVRRSKMAKQKTTKSRTFITHLN